MSDTAPVPAGNNDLVARIRAAIDEDERIARAANPGPWQFRIPGANHLDQHTVFGDGWPHGLGKLTNVCGVDLAGMQGPANAVHIVQQNPDRVIRQCKAHRELLEMFADHDVCCGGIGQDMIAILAGVYEIPAGVPA